MVGKKCFFVICILFCFLCACATSARRFPTFAEMQTCMNGGPGCEKQHEYKQYRPDEISRILKKDNFVHRLSVAIQQSDHDDLQSLWQLVRQKPEKPAAVSAFLTMCILKDLSQQSASEMFPQFQGFESLIDDFKNIAPDNALPYYFEAYFKYTDMDYRGGNNALTSTLDFGRFTNYAREIIRYSMQTSDFLSYPKYISISLALDNAIKASTPQVFKKLTHKILEQSARPYAVWEAVFRLGEHLENEGFMMVSKIAGNFLKIMARERQQKDITDLRKEQGQMMFVYSDFVPLSNNFDESQLYAYFDRALETDELSAMKSMLKRPEQQ